MMAPRMLPLLGLAACATNPASVSTAEYYGTLEPFASEAVYFVITDRFVDGDASNNHPEQGGPVLGTFDRPLQIEGRPPANIGYLGGDFKGIVNNAHYISELGFTALWLTPIVENPDEAFTGGTKPGDGILTDLGKTGYHGYWGVNFFEVDEHWPSDDLRFEDVTRKLRQAGIKTVLDVVCNHGSPAYTMPKDQPLFGELYDAQGRLIADHQNLHPSKLDPNNPLHAFFRRTPDLAQLADVDFDNPAVLDYFVSAHLKWIDSGRGCTSYRHNQAYAAPVLEGVQRSDSGTASKDLHVRRGVFFRGYRDRAVHPAQKWCDQRSRLSRPEGYEQCIRSRWGLRTR